MTFGEYLQLSEDAAAELAQLGMRRQQLVMKKAMMDRQIDNQIAALDKTILQKERQKSAADKKDQQTQNQQQSYPTRIESMSSSQSF